MINTKFYNGYTFKFAFLCCLLLFFYLYYIFFVNTTHQYKYYTKFISTNREATKIPPSTIAYDLTTTTMAVRHTQQINSCYLLVCLMGNLGNQIWEYMSLYVVWKKFIQTGYTPYIEENMLTNLKVLFPKLSIKNSILADDSCSGFKERIILKNETLEKYVTWFNYSSRETCWDIYLDDYSSRYDEILAYGFNKIKQEEMRFSPRLIRNCQSTLLYYKTLFNLTDKDVTFIGIHYRGGDYLRHLNVTYPHQNVIIPDHKYYLRAMKYFEETYENVIFIFITIDMEWLSQNITPITANRGKIVFNPFKDFTISRVHDLVLLSQCNHSIINYGTFGTTAALFAGGTTFVYDLKLPLDHRGSTVAMGIASVLQNWHVAT